MIKMITTTEYSDVTIMCDDSDFQFKTHKSILSACSLELDKIIRKTTEKNPVIYLRGVHTKEMEALIQFMYLGRTTINQRDLPELLKVAQDLKIKGIGDKDKEDIRNSPKNDDEIIIVDKSTEDKMMNESDATGSSFRPNKVLSQQNKTDDMLEENVLFDNDHENKSLIKSLDFKRTIKNAMTKVNEDHESSFGFSFEQAFPNDEKNKSLSPQKTKGGSENVDAKEDKSQPAKRGRGRPRKSDIVIKEVTSISDSLPAKRGRGRPRKVDMAVKQEVSTCQEDVIVKDPLAEAFTETNITV